MTQGYWQHEADIIQTTHIHALSLYVNQLYAHLFKQYEAHVMLCWVLSLGRDTVLDDISW